MSEWISINDKIPPQDGELLLLLVEAGEYKFAELGFIKDGEFKIKDGMYNLLSLKAYSPFLNQKTISRVTHWMPIPEAPNEIQCPMDEDIYEAWNMDDFGEVSKSKMINAYLMYMRKPLEPVPVVDDEKAVRCNECKYYNKLSPDREDGPFARACFAFQNGGFLTTEPDDFCSYGEKRE